VLRKEVYSLVPFQEPLQQSSQHNLIAALRVIENDGGIITDPRIQALDHTEPTRRFHVGTVNKNNVVWTIFWPYAVPGRNTNKLRNKHTWMIERELLLVLKGCVHATFIQE
jgi:hypothetical protein